MIADTVDPIFERITTVRNARDHVAHDPLGLILHPVEITAQVVRSMLCEQPPIATLADRTGCKLRADVADQLHRHARILFQDAQQHLVRLAGFVQLDDRQADAFLENLRRVDGGRSRRDAADVAVMRHRAGPALDDAFVEDRLDDVEVGQMLPARTVGVVIEEDVAGLRSRRMIGDQDAHSVRERAELHRQCQPLGDELPAPVTERGGIVHGVTYDRRIGAAHHDQRHLVGSRRERILDDLEGDRIEARVAHSASSGSSISMLPSVSRRARASCGTTQVASYSSMINGPARQASSSAPREITGVSIKPASRPK